MTTPLISRADADTFFDERLNVTAWTGASDDDKDKALVMATQAFNKLNCLGEKTDEDQENQFPRDDDTTVPTNIQYGCALEAFSYLDGVDPQFEFENLRMVSQKYDGVQSTYDKDHQPENVLAGIMNAEAWRYLKPYLRDPFTVDIRRVS